MAPPNEAADSATDSAMETIQNNGVDVFSISDNKLTAKGITLLFGVPENVCFSSFSSICRASDAPPSLFQQVVSNSNYGGFIGFTKPEKSHIHINSLGKLHGRSFLSIFRFKTWWSTMWVGNSGSQLQKETQWILLDIPEIRSYALILPVIENNFRSALIPGDEDHIMICAESGSTKCQSSSFQAIAYLHFGDNPYTLMKEAYTAVRVHLNTFRLLGEKHLPSIVDKFGWCTWDAFYLTVEPAGIWQGVKGFTEGGLPLRFVIIDDGWQSISMDGDNPTEDAKNLILCGGQMTARLYRFEENEKFKKYKAGCLLGPNPPSFDPNRPKMLISKAIDIEIAENARNKAGLSGLTDLSSYDYKIEKLRRELDEMLHVEEHSGDLNTGSEFEEMGLRAFIRDLRKKYKGLDDIYIWHALCGAWGGVRPGTTHLKAKVIPCKPSPGLDRMMNDIALEKLVEAGIGLVDPNQSSDFYNSMHSYLASTGITGVKVDVIHTLELLGEEYGGRVELAKKYYKGLSESLVRNFNGTGLISSMQQCNDFFFLGTWQNSLARVGEDFWGQDTGGDPMGVYWLQGVHLIHCAYNSLWMGQMIRPDWDMFQSNHRCAKFHAGSRAVSGGPVYVSDVVGGHDFELLRKLVFPDGTIPRCQHFALPTRDCLFKNPLFDGESTLKIWNLNKHGGVIGAFNCQGAGWVPKKRIIEGYPHVYKPISCPIHVNDVEWNQTKEANEKRNDASEYALYLNQAEKLLVVSPESDPLRFIIQPSTFEIFSFVPVKKLSDTVKVAPIGLVNMFNSGGTIVGLEYNEDLDEIGMKVKVKGEGKLLIYSNQEPKECKLDGAEVGYQLSADGKLLIDVKWMEENCGVSEVALAY